jgi:hypothetical protein
MKKISISIAFLSSIFFTPSIVLASTELGEFCWQSTQNSCVLKLQATQNGNYFSFQGKEICSGTISGGIHSWLTDSNAVNVSAHIPSGSGYITEGQVEIGLSIIASATIQDTNQDNYRAHMDTVFVGKIDPSDFSITQKNEGPEGGSSSLAYTSISCNP